MSDRSVDIDILTNVHAEYRGECRHDHDLWPCHTGIALAETARLTGDTVALREQLDSAIRKAGAFDRAYHAREHLLTAAEQERDEAREHLAAERSARAALVEVAEEAVQVHEMTASYLEVLEPTWHPGSHESRVSCRTQVATHRARVKVIRALLDQQSAPAAGPRAAVEE